MAALTVMRDAPDSDGTGVVVSTAESRGPGFRPGYPHSNGTSGDDVSHPDQQTLVADSEYVNGGKSIVGQCPHQKQKKTRPGPGVKKVCPDKEGNCGAH